MKSKHTTNAIDWKNVPAIYKNLNEAETRVLGKNINV